MYSKGVPPIQNIWRWRAQRAADFWLYSKLLRACIQRVCPCPIQRVCPLFKGCAAYSAGAHSALPIFGCRATRVHGPRQGNTGRAGGQHGPRQGSTGRAGGQHRPRKRATPAAQEGNTGRTGGQHRPRGRATRAAREGNTGRAGGQHGMRGRATRAAREGKTGRAGGQHRPWEGMPVRCAPPLAGRAVVCRRAASPKHASETALMSLPHLYISPRHFSPRLSPTPAPPSFTKKWPHRCVHSHCPS